MLAILAEKPSAMRNMEKAFGGHRGTFNGEEYELCCARGHLFEHDDPEKQVVPALKEKYHSWNLANMPWNPDDFKWKYKKKEDVETTLNGIKDVFSRCTEIVIATDDDPSGEGTLLADEIIIELGFDKGRKISRMFFADEAPASLQKAFKNRKHFNSLYDDPDYVKALYRCKWDYCSMQFTRIASKCGDGQAVLRQGRLKSAMTLLVGEQLEKVNNYKKVPFYQYKFKDDNDNIFSSEDEPKYNSKEEVPKNVYTNSPVVVEDKQHKKSAPPKLIDLATLSARLSSKGFKAKEVLDTYQKLYEAQIVSYPRTEDKAITIEQFNELLPLCDKIAQVVGVDPKLLTNKSPRAGFVKEGMAHGANRPGINVPKSMSDLAQYGKCAEDIYNILARSYLAMLCADYEYDAQDAHLEKYPAFKSHVNIPTFAGWKAVYNDDADVDDDENAAGFGKIAEPYIHEGFPPKPQTPTMKWLMKQLEKADVGTGATRTSTYADVTNEKSKYPLMKDSKGKISMTEYGTMAYKLLPGTHIGSLEITKHVFDDMKEIAAGKKDPDECLKEVAQFVMDDMKIMDANGKKMREELGISMKGSANVEKVTGKYNGKDAEINRFWSGHRFTDDEIAKLFAGETIQIEAVSQKTGKNFNCEGCLEEYTFKGKKCFGFVMKGFVDNNSSNDGPTGWCKYTFTEKERQTLLSGGEVDCKKFVGKSGKKFGARVKWNAAEKKIDVVAWLK